MAENARIEELRRRVQADPASIAFAALAEEFRRVGRYQDAIETCRTGLQRHPAYLSARVTLGRALIETGDYDGAREELETVLRSAPENLAALRGIEQIHERLGHSTEMHPDLHEMVREPIRLAAEARQAHPPAPSQDAAPFTPVQLVPELPPWQAAHPATAGVGVDDGVGRSPVASSAAPSHQGPEGQAGQADEPVDIFAAALQRSAAATAGVPEASEPTPATEFTIPDPADPPAPPPLAFEWTAIAFEAPVMQVPDAPDPHVAGALLRLERFLVAIQTARHA